MLTLNKESSSDIEIIRSYFTRHEKPWNPKVTPKVYNWKTSIPESWLKLHGKQHFQKAFNNSDLRITARALNNSREFLHTLANFSPKSRQKHAESQRKRKIIINLADLSQDLDLINRNKYIADKIKSRRGRSCNTTPLKRKYAI